MNEGSEEKGGKKKVGEGCREVEERFWWRNGVFVMQGSTSFTSETSLPIKQSRGQETVQASLASISDLSEPLHVLVAKFYFSVCERPLLQGPIGHATLQDRWEKVHPSPPCQDCFSTPCDAQRPLHEPSGSGHCHHAIVARSLQSATGRFNFDLKYVDSCSHHNQSDLRLTASFASQTRSTTVTLTPTRATLPTSRQRRRRSSPR